MLDFCKLSYSKTVIFWDSISIIDSPKKDGKVENLCQREVNATV